MKLGAFDIGVCSWSLEPGDTADLVARLRQVELQHVQLALYPLLFLDDKRLHRELSNLRAAQLVFTGGMIGFLGEDYSSIDAIRRTGGFMPDADWPLRSRIALQAAKLAAQLGITAVTTHVGFIPPKGHKKYPVMCARLAEVADQWAPLGVSLLMETGQESALELRQFIADVARPNLGVNFDPANMILYGSGDPLQAIAMLGAHIRHVHVKDAVASAKPGEEWGIEVPFGTGQVNPTAFIAALRSAGYRGPLVIEREAGSDRISDVRTAVHALRAAV